MALVAYDYDSSSEDEEKKEDEDGPSAVEFPRHAEIENRDEAMQQSISKMLSNLPKMKTSNSSKTIANDELEDFIPKYQAKEKQKVKITIPLLSQFQDEDGNDDEPHTKKSKKIDGGSGLLSILPPVKSSPLTTKSFIPHAVKKNKSNPTSLSSLIPHNVQKRAELAKKAAIEKITKKPSAGSDLESDDDIETPNSFDEEMWNKVCGRPKPKENLKVITEDPDVNYGSSEYNFDTAPEPEKRYDGLDNTAFRELMGKSKRPVNIKLIDVNEDEILPEKELWMTKALTDPDCVPKPAVEEPVDPTRRKKHHITYLAEQAKANEQELQGQWSANKFTRNQTRAKYGF